MIPPRSSYHYWIWGRGCCTRVAKYVEWDEEEQVICSYRKSPLRVPSRVLVLALVYVCQLVCLARGSVFDLLSFILECAMAMQRCLPNTLAIFIIGLVTVTCMTGQYGGVIQLLWLYRQTSEATYWTAVFIRLVYGLVKYSLYPS